MPTCPKGHNSTEADFCSECGAKIRELGMAELSSNRLNTPVSSRSVATQPCPDCSTPHEADSGNFCEICGYNFLTGTQGGDPLSNFPPIIKSSNSIFTAPTQRPTPAATAIDPPLEQLKWELVILIDPSLATPESPAAPTQAPMKIQLKLGSNLIGRTSQARAIYPEIPLDLDDAVSSRHAILTLHPDGALVLRDIGSSNGTMVNGKEVAIMADMPISSGDEISLGHWTKIKITYKS